MSKVITSKDKILAHCPTCKRDQNSTILTGIEDHWSKNELHGTEKYLVIMCHGCDTIFMGQFSYFSEDFEYVGDPGSDNYDLVYNERRHFYPEKKWRDKPKWFSVQFQYTYENLSEMMDETYEAANRNWFILAAMGVRTCFDVAGDILGLDKRKSFSEKIDQLRSRGYISPREKQILSTLVDIGSAAAHRGWKPSKDNVDLLLDALETFVHHAIVLPEGLDRLHGDIPVRKNN